MKILKRSIALVLCAVMLLSMCACGKKKDESSSKDDNSNTQVQTVSYTDQPSAVTKSETVYVSIDSTGKTTATTVTDWLHTDKAKVKVYDKSDLADIKNVKTYICDMKNINELKIECDCIFALDQGIQYLNYSNFKNFLENSYSVTKYIVLELFDFNLGKTLTYYDSKIEDNKFYFSKQFTFNDLNIKRYNKHIHYKTHIEFWYQYFNKDNLVFETNFKLYNYEYNMIKKIVDKSNKFVIQEKNEAENGTYIIVLKRISNKK